MSATAENSPGRSEPRSGGGDCARRGAGWTFIPSSGAFRSFLWDGRRRAFGQGGPGVCGDRVDEKVVGGELCCVGHVGCVREG